MHGGGNLQAEADRGAYGAQGESSSLLQCLYLGNEVWKLSVRNLCDLYFPIPQALGTPKPIPTHIFLEQLLSVFGEEAGKAVCLTDLGLQVRKGWDWGVSLWIFWWEKGGGMRAAQTPAPWLLLPGWLFLPESTSSALNSLIFKPGSLCPIPTDGKWGTGHSPVALPEMYSLTPNHC